MLTRTLYHLPQVSKKNPEKTKEIENLILEIIRRKSLLAILFFIKSSKITQKIHNFLPLNMKMVGRNPDCTGGS